MPTAEGARATGGGPARSAAARLGAMLAVRGGAAASLQTFVTSVAILGLNLGTGMLTARWLGPAGRGELAAIIVWPQFMAFALSLGLPSSLLFNLKVHDTRGRELFSAVLLLGALTGVVASASGALLIPLWLTEYSSIVVRFAQWAMLTAPVPLFNVVLISAMQAREEFGTYNVSRAVQVLLTLVLLAALALAGRMTSFAAAMVTLFAPLPVCVWMLLRLWRIYRPVRRGLGWASARLMSFGLRCFGADLIGALVEQVDRVMVVGLLDPARMGLYVVALGFSQILNVVPTAIVTVLFPKSSGRSTEEVVEMTGRAVRVSLLANVLAAAPMALLGPLILDVVYGDEFREAAGVLRILLFEAVMRGTIWILAQAFLALGRPGFVTLLQGLGLALMVPLLLLLVPKYGLVGAGLALLISTSARFVAILLSFPYVLRHRPPALLLRRSDLDAFARLGFLPGGWNAP